ADRDGCRGHIEGLQTAALAVAYPLRPCSDVPQPPLMAFRPACAYQGGGGPMDGSELMSHERESRRGVAHAGSLARLDLDVLAASSTDVCILISGPGSAQEVARRIHGLTRARPGRFRAVDCGWAEALLEQQLFQAIRPGSSGTVFLEEIGRLTPELQDRLLQTLDAPPDHRGPRAPRARGRA